MSLLKSNFEYKILVVDDTKIDRDLYVAMLKQVGFSVDTAANGEEAIAMLEKQKCDLILCDYSMPVLDGLGFLRKVRQIYALSHLVVIIVTSDETQESKVVLLKAGANDFIHKGASADEFMARVRTHLEASEISWAKAVLKTAGGLVNEISQPLSAMAMAIVLLKENIEKDVSASKREQMSAVLQTLSLQVDRLTTLTNNIRKLGMDPSTHQRVEKMLG